MIIILIKFKDAITWPPTSSKYPIPSRKQYLTLCQWWRYIILRASISLKKKLKNFFFLKETGMLVFLLVLAKWPYVRIGRPIFKRNFHEIRTDTCLFQRNKIRIQALSQSIRDRSFAAAPQVNVVIGTGPTGQGESGFSIRVCSSLGQWPKEATYGRGSKFVPYALAISEAASIAIAILPIVARQQIHDRRTGSTQPWFISHIY